MQKKISDSTIANAVLLGVDLAGLIFMTVFVMRTRSGFMELYIELYSDYEIPIMTRIALQSHYIFISIAIILIAKEWLKNKSATLIINFIVFGFLLVSIFIYLIALYLPVFNIGGLIG